MANPTRSSEYGLYARAAKPWRRWAVDMDYAGRLGPAERAWLERFGREYYGADAKALRAPDALHRTNDLRESVYGAQNAAYRDAMSCWARGGEVPEAGALRWGEHVEPARKPHKSKRKNGP